MTKTRDKLHGRHQGTADARRFLNSDHLPAELSGIVEPAAQLADFWIDTLKDGPQLTRALNLLVDAKDCAVRQAVCDRPVDDESARRDRIERMRSEVNAWDVENGRQPAWENQSADVDTDQDDESLSDDERRQREIEREAVTQSPATVENSKVAPSTDSTNSGPTAVESAVPQPDKGKASKVGK